MSMPVSPAAAAAAATTTSSSAVAAAATAPSLRPILSSFPSPPTHIPASPSSYTPPLSAVLGPPPTVPLPPLPDVPSPVTPAEQFAFINLRRSSVLSKPKTRPGSQASSLDDPGQILEIHDNNDQEDDSDGDDDRVPTPSLTPTAHVHPINDTRAGSPDIALLIERTPGRRRTLSFHSHGKSRTPMLKRLRSTPALGRHPGATRTTRAASATYDEVWRSAGSSDTSDQDVDPDVDDLDSEEEMIDLHTPLPHLMLRAGLLSPHSKLLPRPSPSPEPMPATPLDDGRVSPTLSAGTAASHGTTLSTHSSATSLSTIASAATTSTAYTSTTSMTTHSTPPRDARDTARRRARHKDGRLLRGGIGLTTGLGWSDSEDEDAPSALTNRLSRLAPTLSRKSSKASSVASNASGYGFPLPGYPSPDISAGLSGVGGYGSSYAPVHVPGSAYASATASAPTSTSVSRASSVASSPARVGFLGLSEGRSLSRSTAGSLPSLRRTGSSASSVSLGAGSTAGDVEGRESTVLAYLAPPLETEERMYDARRVGGDTLLHKRVTSQEKAVAGVRELHVSVPEYPYFYSPPSPTDMGHSSVGHGQLDAEDGVLRSPFYDDASGHIQRLQIQIQNQVEQSLQHSSLRMQHQNMQKEGMARDDDRSPTPTCTGASPAELAETTRNACGVTRERDDAPPTLTLRMPRSPHPGAVGMGVASRPVSKALPPLPTDGPRRPRSGNDTSTTSVGTISRPQSRSSGIPKTASLSSLRSTASRQGVSAGSTSVPIPASASLSLGMSSTASATRRDRAASNASMQSVRSVRSVSSVSSVRSAASAASVSTATGGARQRPSLPTPKVLTPPLSAPATGSLTFMSLPPTPSVSTLPSTPGVRTSISPPPSTTPTPRARRRTSSTSSTASGRPLKSAIKLPASKEYGSGMAVPRARYVTGSATATTTAAGSVGVGVGVGTGHTGIAI